MTISIRGSGWQADCPKCVASKFTCDEHYRRTSTEPCGDAGALTYAEALALAGASPNKHFAACLCYECMTFDARVHGIIEGWSAALSRQQPSLTALERELVEALKPFAAMAEYLDDTMKRSDAIYCGGTPGLRCEVTHHDYHVAALALASARTGGE